MIAGLLTPDRGSIALDGIVLFDAAAGINMPPHLRHIGYVFQEGRLFPHLSVRQNLDYGRRMSRRRAMPQRSIASSALLDLGPLLERRPRMLSGGERQRVAVGRALLMRARLLLLDEPLASLDAGQSARFFLILARLRDDAGNPDRLCQPHAGGKCAASPPPWCGSMPAASSPPAASNSSRMPTQMRWSDIGFALGEA